MDPDNTGPILPSSTTYQFDAVGNLTKVTDAVGNETDFVYDGLDRLVTQTLADADGPGGDPRLSYDYDYDAVGNLLSVTDSWGRETATTYDNLYRQLTVTLPDPDALGSQTSPVWSFQYSDDMLLTQVTDPMSATATRGYDDAGRLTSLTDTAGVVTTFAYDVLDRLVSETLPDPDGAGTLTASTTSYAYDALSRLTSTTNANGETTSYTYDDVGQLLSLTDASSNTTRFAYDGRGRRTLENDARGNTKSMNFNSVGRLVRQVDQTGRVIRYVNDGYDSFERWYEYSTLPEVKISTVTDGGASTNEVQNIELVNLPATTNGDTNFFRVAIGGQVALIEAGATASEVEAALEDLDAVSDVSVAGSNGDFDVTFEGNLGFQNIDKVFADALRADDGLLVHEMEFTYDELWRLTDASDSFASYQYGYDGLHRVNSVQENITGLTPQIDLARDYNLVGNLTSVSATVGGTDDWSNTYEYDNLDRLITIQQTGQAGGNSITDKRVKITYNSLGQRTYVNRYEATTNSNPAIRTVYNYDSGNRLSAIQHRAVDATGSTTLLHRYDYTYDGQNRIDSIDSSNEGLSLFSYDQIGQLTSADHAVGRPDESYDYDATGNRPGFIGDGNLLLSGGRYDYENDENGNLITKSYESFDKTYYLRYEWDHRNRLVEVIDDRPEFQTDYVTELSYDVFNRLVRVHNYNTDINDNTTSDLFFAGFDEYHDPSFQFVGASAGDIQDRYLMHQGEVFAQQSSLIPQVSLDSDVLWSLNDHLGTARDIGQLIHSTGEYDVVNARVYDSFGNLISQTGTSYFDFAFTGQMSFGLVGNYHHNRWYDPGTGRWLSNDPIGFSAGDTNLQRYVGNSPLTYVDLDGLEAQLVSIEEDAGQGKPKPKWYRNYHAANNFAQIGAREGNAYDRAYQRVDANLRETIETLEWVIASDKRIGLEPESRDVKSLRALKQAYFDPLVVQEMEKDKTFAEHFYDNSATLNMHNLIGLAGSKHIPKVKSLKPLTGGSLSPTKNVRAPKKPTEVYHHRTPSRDRVAPKETLLPDSYWINRKAPTQVAPGTRTVNIDKPSSSGGTYHSTTHYDEFGRQIGQTHRTHHGYSNPNSPQFHPNPHHHRRNPITGEKLRDPRTGSRTWPGLFGNDG